MPAQGTMCVFLSDQRSDGNCKDAVQFRCTLANGDVWQYTRVLTQMTANGSELSGEESEQGSGPGVYNGAGCYGTYSVTATRQ
jgi:hypothetical protein